MEKRKIKNIVISALTTFFIVNYSYKLIKEKKHIEGMIDNHVTHYENIVAHRGFSGLFRENSIDSITNSLSFPCVDMVEFDIRYSENGKIVLYHDEYINTGEFIDKVENSSIDDEVMINEINWLGIREFFGSDTLFLINRYLIKKGDNFLCQLEDILKVYDFSKKLIIDVKIDTINASFMDYLAIILQNYIDNIYIQSDNYAFLKLMQEKYPEYKYLYIVKSLKSYQNDIICFDGYTINHDILNQINIYEDKEYFVYTINSSKDFFELINSNNYRDDMYIITDHPDYICSLSYSKKIKK